MYRRVYRLHYIILGNSSRRWRGPVKCSLCGTLLASQDPRELLETCACELGVVMCILKQAVKSYPTESILHVVYSSL